MYFGSRVFASPLQANVASGRPSAVTQIGLWSTPMNQVFGLSWAAWTVADARLKPTVTMTSNFWSTNDLIDGAYSEALVGTIEVGAAAPIAAAPSCAPLNEYSLKFLSLSVPMSVTTPILRSEWAPEAAADGSVEAALAAGAAAGGGARTAAGRRAPPPAHGAARVGRPAHSRAPMGTLGLVAP